MCFFSQAKHISSLNMHWMNALKSFIIHTFLLRHDYNALQTSLLELFQETYCFHYQLLYIPIQTSLPPFPRMLISRGYDLL